MASLAENNEEIRQYLLGNLPEEARQRVETRLLTEKDFLTELLACEDELIDQYFNQELSGADLDKFESSFLCTPERQQSLRFAKNLQRYINVSSEEATGAREETEAALAVKAQPAGSTLGERLSAFWESSTWGLRAALTLGVFIIIAGALWFSLFRARSPQTFAALTLSVSSGNRADGVEAAKLRLPLKADALRISLTIPEGSGAEPSRYRVQLANNRGETKNLEPERQDAQSVSVVIPANELARGAYALKLFRTTADGTEERVPGSYFFTVE